MPYLRTVLPVVLLAALAGCGPDYSPNTYSTAAVQQANKVDQGVIAGYREVAIRADGTVGAVTGGAAGGVLGAQAPEGGVITALSAIGGTLIGGIVGTSVEHAANDTKAFEYIVRKTSGDLVSVTQKDDAPLAVGLKVLVIEGKQARVVPDYSVPPDSPAPSASATGEKSHGSKADKLQKAEKPNSSDKTNASGTTATEATAKTGTSEPSAAPPRPADTPQQQTATSSIPTTQQAAPPAAEPSATPADQGATTMPSQEPTPVDALR